MMPAMTMDGDDVDGGEMSLQSLSLCVCLYARCDQWVMMVCIRF